LSGGADGLVLRVMAYGLNFEIVFA